MAKKIDIEEEEQKVKEQTRFVRNIAIVFLAVVVSVMALILWGQYQDILSLTPEDIKNCEPGILCMSPNEWGDFFAGSGATIALIFISWGLFLQTKELSLQRIEMRANRQEQEETTEAVEKSRKEETTRTLFRYAVEQLQSQQTITLKIEIERNVKRNPHRTLLNDVVSVFAIMENSNYCRITKFEIVEPNELNVENLVSWEFNKQKRQFRNTFILPESSINPDLKILIITVHYEDKFLVSRKTTAVIDVDENVMLAQIKDEGLVLLEEERQKFATVLRESLEPQEKE